MVQCLTVYGDGRSELRLTRQLGDADMPERLREWTIRRDRATGLINFERAEVLPTDQATALLQDAVQAGVVDLQSVDFQDPEQLTIESALDGQTNNATGPVTLGATFDWQPARWVNRQRWQKTAALPTRLGQISRWLEKREFILVDDHGEPVSPND